MYQCAEVASQARYFVQSGLLALQRNTVLPFTVNCSVRCGLTQTNCLSRSSISSAVDHGGVVSGQNTVTRVPVVTRERLRILLTIGSCLI